MKPLQEERTRCTFPGCSKTFSTSGHMVRHLKIHTGEKMHHCLVPGCTRSFARKDNRNHHYKSHQRKLERSAQGRGLQSGSEQSISPEITSSRPNSNIAYKFDLESTIDSSPDSIASSIPNLQMDFNLTYNVGTDWALSNLTTSGQDLLDSSPLDFYLRSLASATLNSDSKGIDYTQPFKNEMITLDTLPSMSSQFAEFSSETTYPEDPWRFDTSGFSLPQTFAYHH